MSLTNYELWSFRDAVEHVVDVFTGQDSAPRTWRNARSAVREAYRQLPTDRPWSYYDRVVKINTVATQTTGTVSYDHTGGTNERQITLVGATWPTDVRYYELLVGRQRFEIDDYKSSTVLTLTEASNPGVDFASTGYTLYRDTYPLPADFYRIGTLCDVLSGVRTLSKVDIDDLVILDRGILTTQLPYQFAITASPHYAGGEAIKFGPSPTTVRMYDAAYAARGRPLNIERETTGTLTVTSGSASVTGVGTAFTSAMAGSILRVSSDAVSLPTGPRGNIDASEIDNPYSEQYVIKSVTNATTLTLEQAATTTRSAVKFTISDRLDIEAGAMLNYFWRLCEAKFARIEGRKDAETREAAALREFYNAAGADKRSYAQSEPMRGPLRLRDLATSVNLN